MRLNRKQITIHFLSMTSLWRHLPLTSIAYDWRRKLETGSRQTTGAYTLHTADADATPTRLNSTVESRRRRRCVLGLTLSIRCRLSSRLSPKRLDLNGLRNICSLCWNTANEGQM